MVPLTEFQIVGSAVVAMFKAARVWTEPRRFLKVTVDGADFQDRQGGDCLGVSFRSKRASGDLSVRVAVIGYTSVEVGGNVRDGDEIISDARGMAIRDPQMPGSRVHIQGIARSGGVEGKSIVIELRRYKLAHPSIGENAAIAGGR